MITRTNAYSATVTVLIQLKTDVWEDVLLDYEDELNDIALEYFQNTSVEDGKIFLFTINVNDEPRPFVRIIRADREGEATDTLNEELTNDEYIMNCYVVEFEIRNHVRNETWV